MSRSTPVVIHGSQRFQALVAGSRKNRTDRWAITANVFRMDNWNTSFGAIALAAYQPEPSAFLRQLRSIQVQSHRNFVCIISVDGGSREIQSLIESELHGDSRFRVVGFENRLGFYRNFERALLNVPANASWIALADQDDYWYPAKLEMLLPHLASASLVSGQARVVTGPDNFVLSDSTDRKQVGLQELLLRNQVTGAMSIFRRRLLDVAIPFPANSTLELHDHWLGMCAAATDGLLIREELVQDYIQHGNNALGEPLEKYSVVGFFRKIEKLAYMHTGDRSLRSLFRAANDVTFGWSRAMVDTLSSRISHPADDLQSIIASFGSGHEWKPTIQSCYSAAKSGKIGKAFLMEFAAGLPGEALSQQGFSSESR